MVIGSRIMYVDSEDTKSVSRHHKRGKNGWTDADIFQ